VLEHQELGRAHAAVDVGVCDGQESLHERAHGLPRGPRVVGEGAGGGQELLTRDRLATTGNVRSVQVTSDA
jgi:hypothetical protein